MIKISGQPTENCDLSVGMLSKSSNKGIVAGWIIVNAERKGCGSTPSWLFYITTLSRHLSGGNEEHHRTIQPIFCVSILNKI